MEFILLKVDISWHKVVDYEMKEEKAVGFARGSSLEVYLVLESSAATKVFVCPAIHDILPTGFKLHRRHFPPRCVPFAK